MQQKIEPYISLQTEEIRNSNRLLGYQTQYGENKLQLPTELDEFEGPTLFYCSTCNTESVSVCEYKPTFHTFLCAFLLFFIINIFSCFIIYFTNTCKDRKQVCPKCGSTVGLNRYNACAC